MGQKLLSARFTDSLKSNRINYAAELDALTYKQPIVEETLVEARANCLSNLGIWAKD